MRILAARVLAARIFATLAILAAAFALAPSQSQAREYPWCALYDWEAENCGFVTFEQCLAAVSGVGGHCALNPRYVAGPPRSARSQRPR